MWRAAKSLLVLHAQLRPLAPKADPKSWGLIGDTKHDTTSDHAPHNFPGWGREIVTAADFPKSGNCDPREVLNDIRLSRDPRAKYGISEGEMFSSYPAHGYPAWVWRPYNGKDGHFDHGHLSVVGDARADDTRPWAVGGDMTPEQISWLKNVYDAIFYGGTSMGAPAGSKVNAKSTGNALVDLLQDIRTRLDRIEAAQKEKNPDV